VGFRYRASSPISREQRGSIGLRGESLFFPRALLGVVVRVGGFGDGLGLMRKRHAPSRASVRPIDKNLVSVAIIGQAATQSSVTLAVFTSPCTLVGLRWSIGIVRDAGSGIPRYAWGIVIVRDGNVVSSITLSNTAQTYTPEQSLMAYGCGCVNAVHQQFDGGTKTGRKVRNGDSVEFVAIGVATNTVTIQGSIQFFCRS